MKTETALRQIRQRIFDYPPEKEAQSARVLSYLKKRVMREHSKAEKLGPFSGLTRAQMPAHLCETDFY